MEYEKYKTKYHDREEKRQKKLKEVFFTDKTSLKIFDFITCVKNSSTAYVEKENFQRLK